MLSDCSKASSAMLVVLSSKAATEHPIWVVRRKNMAFLGQQIANPQHTRFAALRSGCAAATIRQGSVKIVQQRRHGGRLLLKMKVMTTIHFM